MPRQEINPKHWLILGDSSALIYNQGKGYVKPWGALQQAATPDPHVEMAPGAHMTYFIRGMSSYVKEQKGVSNDMPLVPGDHATLPQSYGLLIIWTFNELTDMGGGAARGP